MTFSDAAASAAPAVPTTPGPLDPDNPQALGYDPFAPGFAAARAAAGAAPELAAAFASRLRRETARFEAWVHAYRHAGSGGCGRGGPDPFVPTDPGTLLAQARQALERRRRWRASPPGRLSAALAEAEAQAEAVRLALVEARAAADRQDGSAHPRCAAVAAGAGRLAACAARLMTEAAAAPDAAPPTPPEQREAFWRFTHEMCAPPNPADFSGAALREG